MSIGDGALLRGRRTRPDEGDKSGTFVGGKAVRFDHHIANAVGAGAGVAVLQVDAFSLYGARRQMGPGRQKLSMRRLGGTAKVGTEGRHRGRPRGIGEAGKSRQGEGADD